VASESVVELVSKVTVFNDLSELLQDEDVDAALARVVKLIAKPDVPFAAVIPLIVELQSLSAKFGIMARYYTSFGDSKNKEEMKRKALYYTLNEEISKLADALKYAARYGN